MFNLFKHELLSRRNAIIGWGIGLFLFGSMYITIYPQMADQLAQFSLTDIPLYQAMGVEMNSFEGFVASSVIQFVPILLGVYAIICGTGTLAGEEDSGTLELILASPLKRWQIVSMKSLAVAIALLLILLIVGLGDMFIMDSMSIETDVTGIDMFWAVMSSWPIVLAFFTIALFFGTVTPNRRIASLVANLILVAGYFGENIGGLVESLEFIRPYSLFSYFDSTSSLFTDGVNNNDMALLVSVAVIFLGLALFGFQRRDVTVGAWLWQRARVAG